MIKFRNSFENDCDNFIFNNNNCDYVELKNNFL